MIQTQQLRYFLYARKSSESEDRQMASIEDQIGEVQNIAKELGLHIVAIFRESKSAKAPGRKVFNEMLSQIEKGKADGILCWKLNRLARNPVDGGKISMMLQQSIIKHVQTYSRDYKPTDNVLMMLIEFGMANQFVKDLSVDIKRGTRAKAGRGWSPSAVLPIGYLHNKNTKGNVLPKEIKIDKKRYPIVKRLWELMLTGDYSITDIKRAGDRLNLVSDNKKPYVKATYHKMFSSEFYYGYFNWKDSKGLSIRHKGKHKTMITEVEFDKIQEVIGNRKQDTRPKKYNYPYRGLLKCGECGCGITAERKYQVRCTGCRFKFSCMHRKDCPKCEIKIKDMLNPTVIDVTYYRCSKRKQKCHQKFITQQDLEQQFSVILENIEIQQDFYDMMCDELERLYNQNHKTEHQVVYTLKKQISELNNRLKSLLLMRADDEIDKNDFNTMKKETHISIKELEKEIKKTSYRETYWLEIAKDYLSIALNASLIIRSKDNLAKKSLLSKLGSNQLLLDQKLHFIRAKPLLAIQKCFTYYMAQKERFEPEKNLVKQGDFQGFYTQNSTWCTELHQVRTSAIQLNTQHTNTDLLAA